MSITPDEAKHLLKNGILCKLSYNDALPTKVLSLADVGEAIFIKDPKRKHIRLWVMYSNDGKTVHVVFRGTDSLHSALINTHAALVPFESSPNTGWRGSVHKGYKDTALFARDIIGDQLDDMEHIILTGHSMGGACAQILGAQLSCENLDICPVFDTNARQVETITYGSPPPGDVEFAVAFKEHLPKSKRVVHEYDIVPRLPIPFFKHTHGLKIIRHMPGEKRPCTRQPHTARELAQFIRYHQMNAYIAPLRKIA